MYTYTSKTGADMQLLITTQIQENYGAHDWDGEGACPQYWKFKGGNDYKYDLGSVMRNADALQELAHHFILNIEGSNEYFREYVLGWEVVADDYLTDFEKSQLEYDGEIRYPATRLTLDMETV
jgi:hypothetical protein